MGHFIAAVIQRPAIDTAVREPEFLGDMQEKRAVFLAFVHDRVEFHLDSPCLVAWPRVVRSVFVGMSWVRSGYGARKTGAICVRSVAQQFLGSTQALSAGDP